MKAIWKFPLDLDVRQVVKMPKGAKTLDIQMQNGQFCLWALVDTAAEKVDVVICVHGTGHDVQDADMEKQIYLSTVQRGRYVWHFFKEER